MTPEFIACNREDPAWLEGLPALLAGLAERWSLTLQPPFPDIRICYVAPAVRADGVRCVLKVSRHLWETRTEIAALCLWDGRGAARLLQSDSELGALLLERIEPGTMLVETARTSDDDATMIAARVLGQLWQPATESHGLRNLESWCGAFDRNRTALSRGVPGFPAELFERADALRAELLDSTADPVALHGDLHHFNVLQSHERDWVAIDPKGLVGDRCFDVCQFLVNPGPVRADVNRRRVDIFCSELGLDRRRVKDWCLVHAVLNACWEFEDGNPWRDRVAYAWETLSL